MVAKEKTPSITHVIMISDMSGSMWSLAGDVRGGFNAYIKDLKAQQVQFRITAVVFDTDIDTLCLDATLDGVPEMTAINYTPRGCTALLDAVGMTITKFEDRVKLRKKDKVLVVIQTDGEENSSREWSYRTVGDLIGEREKDGRWGFIYLGTGLDSWEQASKLNIRQANYVNTAATTVGTQSTYSGIGVATVSFAATGDTTASADIIRATPGATNVTSGVGT